MVPSFRTFIPVSSIHGTNGGDRSFGRRPIYELTALGLRATPGTRRVNQFTFAACQFAARHLRRRATGDIRPVLVFSASPSRPGTLSGRSTASASL
jgi:hypothetical protein